MAQLLEVACRRGAEAGGHKPWCGVARNGAREQGVPRDGAGGVRGRGLGSRWGLRGLSELWVGASLSDPLPGPVTRMQVLHEKGCGLQRSWRNGGENTKSSVAERFGQLPTRDSHSEVSGSAKESQDGHTVPPRPWLP